MKLSRRSIIIAATIIITITIDQISKVIVRKYIDSKEVVDIIDNHFSLHNVENTGAFLGMGSDLNETLRFILLLMLPIVVLGFVLHYVLKDKTLNNLTLFAFSSIVGGGISNVYDRIVYGSVTDFLYINLGGIFRTGIFNMADLSVTTGLIILVFVSFKNKKSNV